MSQRHPRPPAAAAAATALGLLAVLTACTGSGSGSGTVADLVSADSLAPGSCREAAGPINAVHREVAGLADDGKAAAARPALAKVTTDLQALAAGAGTGEVASRTTDLVQAVGFLRVGIDTHSYDRTVLTRADDAAKTLAQACHAG